MKAHIDTLIVALFKVMSSTNKSASFVYITEIEELLDNAEYSFDYIEELLDNELN